NKEADFKYTIFIWGADFRSTTFSKEADVSDTIFKDNADFRDLRADATLVFDNTTWQGRVDLRGIRANELHWDSKERPSEVKGVFDVREAILGRATFEEVRFQDVADFSRTNFGQYKEKDEDGKDQVMEHALPQMLFVDNTFEKEADFRHVTFSSSALLSNNRF